MPVPFVFTAFDAFKPLNDRYGHAVGDAALTRIGGRLAGASGVMVAARLGGDEFAVLVEADHLQQPLAPTSSTSPRTGTALLSLFACA